MEAEDQPRKRLTLKEAKALSGSFVYGLCHEHGPIFYVGQTKSPAKRFQAHAERRTKNAGLKVRLQQPTFVVVLADNPADLNAMERQFIQSTPNLVNLIGADSHVWSANSTVPWAAGTGVKTPSAWMMMRAGAEVKAEVRARMKMMSDKERCEYELRLLEDMKDMVPTFERWLKVAGPKMIACMEAA